MVDCVSFTEESLYGLNLENFRQGKELPLNNLV